MSDHKYFDLRVHRRQAINAALGSLLGASASGWLPRLAGAASNTKEERHCVLLWMSGGPSQIDTFDMKPDHSNGGSIQEIQTSVPGIRFSEHLPNLAKQADQLAIVRGVNTKEGDHSRGTYLMRTGQRPGSPVRYPTIGSAITKEIGSSEVALPNYVSINPVLQINPEAFGPGFLGPKYAAATVGEQRVDPGQPQPDQFAEMTVDNLRLPGGISLEQAHQRQQMWNTLQSSFMASRKSDAVFAQDTIYRKAITLMTSDEVAAFDLSKESNQIRESYGRGRFGQGCLIARRLIERGVSFVEVALGSGLGWDTHQNNFEQVARLSEELDNGWSSLMIELKERGLLENTTILWMGEFGRTPQINPQSGRDHFPNAWTCVFAGGGIKGGQASGKTSKDGMEVVDGKVSESDILATLCHAVGVDPKTENISPIGRPHRISEGSPIAEVLR